jgi:hypothetical protein
MKERAQIVVEETNSDLLNVLIQAMCDRRASNAFIAVAGELIALAARASMLILDAKQGKSSRPAEFYSRLFNAGLERRKPLFEAWEAAANEPSFDALEATMRLYVERLRELLDESSESLKT